MNDLNNLDTPFIGDKNSRFKLVCRTGN